MPFPRVLVLTSILVATMGLPGCGSDTDSVADPSSPSSTGSANPSTSTTSPSPTVPDWPSCAEIWKAGAKLPGSYAGCLDGETSVKADRHLCSFGLPIVTYDDRFYAVPRNKINQVRSLAKDQDFQHTLAVCSG